MNKELLQPGQQIQQYFSGSQVMVTYQCLGYTNYNGRPAEVLDIVEEVKVKGLLEEAA